MGNHYSFFEDRGSFNGFVMDALKVDEAYLTVDSHLADKACLYTLNEDCVKVGRETKILYRLEGCLALR